MALENALGIARWGQFRCRCALGRAGVTLNKREGDGATPARVFPLRRVLYRRDRLDRPATRLPVTPLKPSDGWCEDPEDVSYNLPVTLPYGGRCESLWREDAVYDVIVVLGYNDDPVRPGLGSAIFLHVAKPGYAPTEGCIALALGDLLHLLETVTVVSRLTVLPKTADQGPAFGTSSRQMFGG